MTDEPQTSSTRPPHDPDADGFARSPPPSRPRSASDGSPQRGDTIGHYRVLELIGEGGFGSVYLADQTDPVRRRVALKVIKPGMDSKAVIARFEAERQALAMMSHPNVAKVLDAGTTERGQPYFVMEHVKGSPITDYCDRHRLSIEQRLRLFATVCDAVQHAHTKGIIHRDIKPSNILVSIAESGDSGPQPVIIDFGVAKALAGRLTEQTIYTARGELIGTPEYMSPEQAEMAETDIDTRSDVYSLGVVLYELLTGAVPFDSETLRNAGLVAVQRLIREAEPPRPSTRLSTMGDSSNGVAAARGIQLQALESQLRRELEWIPLKALRKDRAERYRSASELADDVANYLAHRPLIAGPESTAYTVRKFARRNKALVAGAAAVAAALLLGVAGITWQAKIARDQREEAVRQRSIAESHADAEAKARKRAEEINAFVTKALKSSDPGAGGKQDTTIAEAMQNAIREIDAGVFKDDPRIEAVLQNTIAGILTNNGRAAEAEPLYLKALATRRRLGTGDDRDVARTLNDLAENLRVLGRDTESEKLDEEALAIRRRLFTSDDQEIAESLNNLAVIRSALGKTAEAEALYVEALAMSRRLANGDDDMQIAATLNNLAALRNARGRFADAEPLLVEALEMNRRLHPGDHPHVATNINSLANVRLSLGKFAEAEALFQEALQMRQRLFKGDHQDVVSSLNGVAGALRRLDRVAEAEPLLVEALAMERRLFTGDHKNVAMNLANLARVRQLLGKPDQAREAFDEAIAMFRRLDPRGTPLLARALWASASLRLERGDPTAAHPELEEAIALAEKHLPPDHPHIKEYRDALAKCNAALKNANEQKGDTE